MAYRCPGVYPEENGGASVKLDGLGVRMVAVAALKLAIRAAVGAIMPTQNPSKPVAV